MNILLVPFFSGLLLIAFLFVFSFFAVIAIKYAYYKLAILFPKKSAIKSQLQPPVQKRKKRKPIRSIEVDPSQIDRIYVKKVS